MLDDVAKHRLLVASDPLLHELIASSSERERSHAMERLVSHIRPVVNAVLARHRSAALREDELQDAAATVMLRLVRRLQLAAWSEESAIRNLDDFTARLAYNAVYELLRRVFPQRTRLKNRLRYLLTRDPRFAVWLSNEDAAGGLAAWKGRADVALNVSMPPSRASDAMFASQRPGDAVDAILRGIGQPVLLNDLTSICAELWGISDERIETDEPRAATNPHDELQTKQQMRILWNEILDLPPQQRAALLLNLRDVDGMNGVALFVLLGIASLAEIAGALEVTTEHLAGFWNELPIDDLTIGSMLGKTRQQVINLRKSARDRLARRMRK